MEANDTKSSCLILRETSGRMRNAIPKFHRCLTAGSRSLYQDQDPIASPEMMLQICSARVLAWSARDTLALFLWVTRQTADR